MYETHIEFISRAHHIIWVLGFCQSSFYLFVSPRLSLSPPPPHPFRMWAIVWWRWVFISMNCCMHIIGWCTSSSVRLVVSTRVSLFFCIENVERFRRTVWSEVYAWLTFSRNNFKFLYLPSIFPFRSQINATFIYSVRTSYRCKRYDEKCL